MKTQNWNFCEEIFAEQEPKYIPVQSVDQFVYCWPSYLSSHETLGEVIFAVFPLRTGS